MKEIKTNLHPDYDSVAVRDLEPSDFKEFIFKKNGKVVAKANIHPSEILDYFRKSKEIHPSFELFLAEQYYFWTEKRRG